MKKSYVAHESEIDQTNNNKKNCIFPNIVVYLLVKSLECITLSELGMTKATKKSYTTKEIAKLSGLTTPRITQMRNGQKVKTANKVYIIKPSIKKGIHWYWNESDVVFSEKGLEAILQRPKRLQSK